MPSAGGVSSAIYEKRRIVYALLSPTPNSLLRSQPLKRADVGGVEYKHGDTEELALVDDHRHTLRALRITIIVISPTISRCDLTIRCARHLVPYSAHPITFVASKFCDYAPQRFVRYVSFRP